MNYAGPERRSQALHRRLYRTLVSALIRRRTITLEWFLALEAFFCGLWILSPHRSIRPDIMLAAIPEWVTGMVFFAHGLAAVLVLMRGRYGQPRSQKNLDFCRRSALGSAGLWTALGISYAYASPTATLAVPILGGFVVAALWVYVRLFLRFTGD